MRSVVQPHFEPADDETRDDTLILHHRGTSAEAVAVFVHGVGGSRYGTWRNFPAFLYDDFPQLDVGLYFYRTGLGAFGGLEKEAMLLAEDVRELARSYRRVVLLGHSMGGLVVKSAVKSLFERGEIHALERIAGLFLLASPQAGSLWASRLLAPFSRDARALRPHGELVTKLAEFFKDRIAISPEAAQSGQFVIPAWMVAGTEDVWVDRLSSGLGLPSARRKLVRGSHTSIVKPEARTDPAYAWIASKIRGCLASRAAPAVTSGGNVPEMKVESLQASVEREVSARTVADPAVPHRGRDELAPRPPARDVREPLPVLSGVWRSTIAGLIGGLCAGVVTALWLFKPFAPGSQFDGPTLLFKAMVVVFAGVLGAATAGACEMATASFRARARLNGQDTLLLNEVTAGALGGTSTGVVLGLLMGTFFYGTAAELRAGWLRIEWVPFAAVLGVVVYSLIACRPAARGAGRRRLERLVAGLVSGVTAAVVGLMAFGAVKLLPEEWPETTTVLEAFLSILACSTILGLMLGLTIGISSRVRRTLPTFDRAPSA